MKLSFRLRYLISGEIYCGSNLAVLVCRLLPLQMCLECGTLAQSGHSQRPHLTTAIRQSPTLLPVYPPTRGQQGGHVTRYPPIRESLHIIDSLGSLQHIHHQSPAEKMRQNIQTCIISCLLQFVEPFLHEYEYWLDTFFMRMSWHWGLVSDGYFAVLLDNWIIVVAELSWFLIILW